MLLLTGLIKPEPYHRIVLHAYDIQGQPEPGGVTRIIARE